MARALSLHERQARAARAHLHEHFASLETQTHAALFGTWVFLASEVLFFGALITLYAAYYVADPAGFHESARHTDLVLGSLMTYLLLTASFLVAAAVVAIRTDGHRLAALALAGAALLGVVFLGLKLLEWRDHFAHGLYPGVYLRSAEVAGGGARAFFTLYYVMTGLHFLHVTAGVVVLAVLAWLTHRRRYGAVYHTPLEVGGLYWHFVDIVWLFLWPMFYLWR